MGDFVFSFKLSIPATEQEVFVRTVLKQTKGKQLAISAIHVFDNNGKLIAPKNQYVYQCALKAILNRVIDYGDTCQ